MRFDEQLREDRRKLEQMSDTASKVRFIWDYYKIPIIAIVAALVITILTVVNNIGRKDICMYAVLVNNDSSVVSCDETVFISELEKAMPQTRGKKVDVNTQFMLGQSNHEAQDMESLQVLNALFAISDMDLYVADEKYFDYFADNGGFADLSKLLEENLLKQYQGDLHYHQLSNGTQIVDGIILHSDSLLHRAGYYHSDVIIGVVERGINMEQAVSFLSQMLSDRN